MKSGKRGKNTSAVEVVQILRDGFWLSVNHKRWFVRFEDFPWFYDATVKQLLNVQLPSPHHLQWPELDVDLAIESLETPEKFPLISRAGTKATF